MDPRRWAKIESVYHAALDKRPGERSGYLAEACAGEPELQREIESLLACADAELKGPVASREQWPTGFRFGSYEIVAPLGAGGMGEVYRAKDTKLRREVAIKTLPREFQTDPGRLARFEREAQVLASLNHSGIASLYGVEEKALVMEFVPGPTLADRIALERIPVEEAQDIIGQLAEALEYAHERGVVHRDLKPANIKLDPDGTVKVLDFGLASIVEEAAADEANGGAAGPTGKRDATVVGTILGTPSYMSPEQARGKKVDKRADIWAFGVIAWEMLTGERLFQGEDAAEILNKVHNQPIEFERVPGKFRKLLERCLDRNPKDRLRDIGEGRFWLADAGLRASRPISSTKLAWIAAALFAAVAATISVIYIRAAPEMRVLRSTILPPERTTLAFRNNFGPMTLSPDGRQMVFGATGEDGRRQLWLRRLDATTVQPLQGTDGAEFPFWSPDSRWVGFFADAKLKKIDTQNGAVMTLADALGGRGGSWSSKGVIVFSPVGPSPLLKIPADGGEAAVAARSDPAVGTNYRFPWFLPDGEHFLFAAQKITSGGGQENVVVGSLSSTSAEVIGSADSNAVYAEGRLLYIRGGTLLAQPFDAKALRATGEAVRVVEGVEHMLNPGTLGVFSVSDTGLLAYQTGEGEDREQLTWFDRTGRPTGRIGEPQGFASIELSPDRKALLASLDDGTANYDLWRYDSAQGSSSRFTFDPAGDLIGVWSHDSQTIVFNSDRTGHLDLYRKATGESGMEELLYADDQGKFPTSWSPDGKFLLYFTFGGTQGTHLWVLPMEPSAPRKPMPLFPGKFRESFGQFSPDGRWVVYDSTESGTSEIYVAPFLRSGEKRRISSNGGERPRWAQDGEIFYFIRANGQLMAAEVRIEGENVEVGAVRELMRGIPRGNGYSWDISADGQRIIAFVPPSNPKPPDPITLVQNWSAGLKK